MTTTVVVAGRGHGGLDLAVAAAREQQLVQSREPARLAGAHPAGVGRAQRVAAQRARRIDRTARFSEPGWQTTRVLPGGLRLSDEASERIFGTSPPAAGLTLVSGAGSGKYDGRSTCAKRSRPALTRQAAPRPTWPAPADESAPPEHRRARLMALATCAGKPQARGPKTLALRRGRSRPRLVPCPPRSAP